MVSSLLLTQPVAGMRCRCCLLVVVDSQQCRSHWQILCLLHGCLCPCGQGCHCPPERWDC